MGNYAIGVNREISVELLRISEHDKFRVFVGDFGGMEDTHFILFDVKFGGCIQNPLLRNVRGEDSALAMMRKLGFEACQILG